MPNISNREIQAYVANCQGAKLIAEMAAALKAITEGEAPLLSVSPVFNRLFDFNGTPVRVITDDKGSPWWVASEVCQVLGLQPKYAQNRLDDDDKSKVARSDLGVTPRQDMWIVNEPGLYSLVLRSRKPAAKMFKRWVTHEVLPQIQMTGYRMTVVENVQVLILKSRNIV